MYMTSGFTREAHFPDRPDLGRSGATKKGQSLSQALPLKVRAGLGSIGLIDLAPSDGYHFTGRAVGLPAQTAVIVKTGIPVELNGISYQGAKELCGLVVLNMRIRTIKGTVEGVALVKRKGRTR